MQLWDVHPLLFGNVHLLLFGEVQFWEVHLLLLEVVHLLLLRGGAPFCSGKGMPTSLRKRAPNLANSV